MNLDELRSGRLHLDGESQQARVIRRNLQLDETVVGVGQFTERIDDPSSYRGMSAVELATAAGLPAALADTGTAAAAVAKAVDTVFGLRQFEISGPMPAALGRSNN